MNDTTEIPVTRAELEAEATRIIERDGMPDETTALAGLVLGYLSEPDKRLLAAELVCLMFGWTGIDDSPRGKATHELWREWVDISGVRLSPEDHPELSDERIAELARRRDETRARTLARYVPAAAADPGTTGGDQ